ncbi:hypothetical protein E4U53_001312 [Claviceps sorghi]|nr:hypothetical protein E4U53_001312 [Claviceps sorghi]
MEDPWDSSPRTPTLPTESISEPARIHLADLGAESRLSASPWGRTGHEGDAWGAWADVSPGGEKSDGAAVVCWELRGEVTAAAMATLPDPWAEEETSMRGRGGEDGNADSGIREEGCSAAEGDRPVSEVRELVDMDDGMARTQTPEETPPGGDTMAAPTAVDGQGSATHHPGGPDPETETRSVASEEGGDACAAQSPAAAAADDETCVTRSSSSSTTTTTTTTTATTLAPPPTALPYPIDLCNLDDLFPETQASFPRPISPARLADTIDDGFTSVAQRKAWYRVSRAGSMRKHNAGADDDYVRVSWHTSDVRTRVLTTIRRWLEEDSHGSRRPGRRPGQHAGAAMFNWDPDAPGVHIGELLSQKGTRAGHARQASAAPHGTVPPPPATCLGSASEPASPVDSDDDWGEMVSSPTADTAPESTEPQHAPDPNESAPEIPPGGDPPPTEAALAAPTAPLAPAQHPVDDMVRSLLRDLPDLSYMLR